MELSEKTKIHVYGIFMILMSVSFLFIDNYSDKTLQIIGVAFCTSLYIMLLFLNSRRYKIFYIKRFCPNIYDTYFNSKQDKLSIDSNLEPLYTEDFIINSSFEELSFIEKEIRNNKDPKVLEAKAKKFKDKIDKTKDKIMNLVNSNIKDDAWLNQVDLYIEKLTWEYGAPYIIFKYEMTLLLKEIEKYNNSLLSYNKLSNHEIESSTDDITYNDIINKDVEFNENSIYVKTRVWDGVKYTIKKQRVFVYKRDYNLDLEHEVPRFHICRCKTIDEFIKSGDLTIAYRKSRQKTVLVRNIDNNFKECRISNLPLCKNCYKKMKNQYTWLNSKTDNEDFIRNVIEKTYWSPKSN